MKDADYYAENSGEFEELTEAQQQIIFEGGEVVETSDTEVIPETDENAEAATSESVVDESKTEEVSDDANTESESEEKEPKLMAKDGENTIPYSQLTEARERADQLEELATQQKTLIEQLQTAQEKDKLEGTTKEQDALIEEYKGEYPEIAEEMKPLFEKMVAEGVSKAVADLEVKFEERVAPLQKTQAEDTARARHDAILAEHPDGVELYSDPKLKEWINTHPPAIRETYSSIMEASTAEDMNGLFSAYKEAKGLNKPAEPVVEDTVSKAKEIIKDVKDKTPASLTDIPATVVGEVDDIEKSLNMSQSEIAKHLEGKTPEQINAWMSKLI